MVTHIPFSVSYTEKFSPTYGAIPSSVGDKPLYNPTTPPSSLTIVLNACLIFLNE